jgi:hypothetical protein
VSGQQIAAGTGKQSHQNEGLIIMASLPDTSLPVQGSEGKVCARCEERDLGTGYTQGSRGLIYCGPAVSVQSSPVWQRRTASASTYFYFFFGTFAPFLRASDSPIAMACFRLFTLPPLPDLPERKVPLFFRRTALATDLLAPLLYLRRDEDFFFVGMKLLRRA